MDALHADVRLRGQRRPRDRARARARGSTTSTASATSTASPACSSRRSVTAGPSSPTRPRGRRASSRTSRCGATRTRGRSSSPNGWPSSRRATSNRVFFTTGGSEAVESAWKLARQYFQAIGQPDRYKVIGRHIAYHGTTMGALSITGVADDQAAVRTAGARRRPRAEHQPVPAPDFLSGDEASSGSGPRGSSGPSREGPESVAAVFLEPVQNSGGCFPPTDGYFQRVREICDQYGVLLVSDEVICAFGRLGHWFGSQRYDYQPDIITMAKGMTSGYSPIGGMIVSDRLVEPFLRGRQTFLHGITFAGHPVSCAVALANLDLIEREGLLENVRANEGAFRATLEKLYDLPIVGDVRGAGLLLRHRARQGQGHARDVQRRRERAAAARVPVPGAVRRRPDLPGRRPRRSRHPARPAADLRPGALRLHRAGAARGPHRGLDAPVRSALSRPAFVGPTFTGWRRAMAVAAIRRLLAGVTFPLCRRTQTARAPRAWPYRAARCWPERAAPACWPPPPARRRPPREPAGPAPRPATARPSRST